MLLKMILYVAFFILVIVWIASAATVISLRKKLLELRSMKNRLKRKDDEK